MATAAEYKLYLAGLGPKPEAVQEPSYNEDPVLKSAGLYGSGLDQASQKTPDIAPPPATGGYKDLATGGMQAMNAGSTPSGALTSAGIYGLMADAGTASAALGPYALAGGLALGAYEQSQKADAMNEQAKIKEAQDRKQNVQMALNQALGATRQLGV